MKAETYVKSIVKKITCSSKRKNDIKMQLLAEIEERTSQGETLSDIMSEMGSVQEVAESFNESIPEEEKKKFKRNQNLKVLLTVLLVLAALVLAVAWVLPKSKPLSESKIFNEAEVETALIESIDLMDANDYSALQKRASSQMVSIFTEETMKEVKAAISDDFGSRTLVGTIYDQEVRQMGKTYAVCQVTVSYENVNVVYTISFDPDMKIAGLYMK